MKTSQLMKSSFLILLFVCGTNSFSNNVIDTSSGPVRGTEVNANGRTVKQYLGIPFAKPPLGELRFQKTQPVEKSEEIIQGDKMPPACIQYIEYPFPWYDFQDGKSEDCLYLNIWVPHSCLHQFGLRSYPVMIWIYGGGFTVGSNRKPIYEGQTLAAEGGVIVVTINYRMAAFGFLYSGDDAAPGNAGMYDMLEAMKWVNQNIAAFGGNPNEVTLVGQSAGSIAIGLLCVSPLTKGLFKRVIMESGSPAYLNADNGRETNIKKSQTLAKAVGCADNDTTISDNSQQVVDCMKSKDAFEIAKALNAMHPTSARSFFPNYGDEILPHNARKALISGDFNNVNVLIGNNHDEGAFQITTANPEMAGFFGKKDPQIDKSKGKELLEGTFGSFQDPDAVIEYYLGSLQDDEYDEIRYQVYTADGDYSLLCPTVYFAESYSKAGNNVYYYFFVHRPSTTPWAEWMGVVHYEEVQFVFGLPLQARQNYTREEFDLSKRMIGIWSNFAKFGNPGRIDWPLYSRDNPTYMTLDTGREIKYGQGPHKDNCDFFRSYFGFD